MIQLFKPQKSIKDGTGLQNYQVELRFSTCASVCIIEKYVPVSFILHHIACKYKFSGVNTFFLSLPETKRGSFAWQYKYTVLRCLC